MWATVLLIYISLNSEAQKKAPIQDLSDLHQTCSPLLYQGDNLESRRITQTLERILNSARASDVIPIRPGQLTSTDAKIVILLADTLGLDLDEIRADYTNAVEMAALKYQSNGIISKAIRKDVALTIMGDNRPTPDEVDTIEKKLNQLLRN